MTSERDETQQGEQPIAYGRGAGDDSPTTTWSAPAYVPPDTPAAATSGSAPAATAPVTRTGGSAARWGIALLVTALVVAGAAIAIVLLTGGSSPSTLVGYVPDEDSVVYAELRLDLPGDQRQKLGDFLSKFPGFADQSTLDAKLDDVMDRIVRAMTDGSHDWTTKIKPWFGGELGVAMGALPEVSQDGAEDPRGVLLATVKDEAEANLWLDEVLASVDTSIESYNGTTVRYVVKGDGRVAAAIIGGTVLVAGDEASVEGAIDGGGNGAFGDEAQFRAARDALSGDGLGYIYLDFGGYAAWLSDVAEELGAADPFAFGGMNPDQLPEWLIARLRVESDSLVFETANRHVESPITIENRASTIAQHLPATTVALFDARNYGAALVALIEQAREDPEVDEQLEQIDSVLGSFDGLEGSLEWIGDLGFALTREGDHVDGGLVITTEDRSRADSLLAFFTSLASIGGSQTGLDIEVRDETHNGVEITVLDFGDWRDLAKLGGATAEEVPFEGRLELAYAVTEDLVTLGLGVDFVKDVLDAGTGESLAESGEFSSLVDRVGAQNGGLVYLDITAVREMLEDFARQSGAEDLAEYETEYRPYLEPFDAMISAPTVGGDIDRSRTVIVVNSVN